MPSTGPVILAPNHFSFMDHFFAGAFVRRRVRFMAKSQLFERPMQWIYTHGGVFPVRRGYQDEDAFLTANGILERGGAIVMYCEGGRSRTGTLSEQPKRGIGRLALESGAPVVPMAIHGSSRVRNWKRAQFPKVQVRYGDAIRWPQVTRPDARPAAGRGERDLRAHQDALRRAGRLRKRASCAIARRFVHDLPPREPQHRVAEQLQLGIAPVIAFDRDRVTVEPAPVGLRDQALLAPEEVDAVAADALVDLGAGEPGLDDGFEEAALELGAGRRHARAGEAVPGRRTRGRAAARVVRAVTRPSTSASLHARSTSARGSVTARSSRVRIGVVTGRPWRRVASSVAAWWKTRPGRERRPLSWWS